MTGKRPQPSYSDKEKADFCELAKEIGIGRAIRELKYPSYPTAMAWMSARGIEPNTDKMMARVKSFHTYYTAEDLLVAFDDAVSVAEEMLTKAETPDDLKRITEALYKIVQTRHLIEGKATAISEKREMTQQDLEILELLNMEKARNAEIEEKSEILGD